MVSFDRTECEGTPVECFCQDRLGLVELLADGVSHQWRVGGDDVQRRLAVTGQHVPVSGLDDDMFEVIVDRSSGEFAGGGQRLRVDVVGVLDEFLDQSLDRTTVAPGAPAEVTREDDAGGVLADTGQDFEGAVLEGVLVVEP